MNLIGKQKRFVEFISKLVAYAVSKGYEATFGEAWRPPETAALYQREGKGISSSNHCIRLALDLNLFKDGKLLTRSEEYAEMGAYWETLSTDEITCVWGGHFKDGNHFSFEHNGVK